MKVRTRSHTGGGRANLCTKLRIAIPALFVLQGRAVRTCTAHLVSGLLHKLSHQFTGPRHPGIGQLIRSAGTAPVTEAHREHGAPRRSFARAYRVRRGWGDGDDFVVEAQTNYRTRGAQSSGTRRMRGSPSPRCSADSAASVNVTPSATILDSSAERATHLSSGALWRADSRASTAGACFAMP